MQTLPPSLGKPPNHSNAIFNQSLGVTPEKKADATQLVYEKNKKKAILMIGMAGLLLVLYSVFYFYDNAKTYLTASTQMSELNAEIKQYNDTVIPDLLKSKTYHKAAYDDEFEGLNSALEVVFPKEIDKLGIVQLLESFSAEVEAVSPPFEFTSINVNASQENEEGYQIIPVTTSIHSSLIGFERFLELVEKSGAIYEDSEAENKVMLEKMVRLMSISNITVKYRGVDEKTGRDGGVDFNVKLDFYSRPSSEQG